MRLRLTLVLAFAAFAPARAADFRAEAGAAWFDLRGAEFERNSTVLRVAEDSRLAPFVAASLGVNERIALRLGYAYLQNLHAVTQLGSPPGTPLPVVVWGNYEDDIHVLTFSPEFSWTFAPGWTVALAPQLNWVASRGRVSYATDSALILLVGPRQREEEDFTLGGAVRLRRELNRSWSLTAGYGHVDLDPSFGRVANVFSGGLQWRF
jgi:hypothetical protein